MTKTLRRVVSVVAALAVMMLMVVPFGTAPSAPQKAEAANDLTITVNNAQPGQTYTLYKLFDATVSSDRASQSDSSAETDVTTNGINYTLPNGKSLSQTNWDSNGSTVTTQPGSTWFDVDAANNVSKKSDVDIPFTDQAFRNWAIHFGTQIDEPQKVEASAEGGQSIVFNNLSDGYYFVTSTMGSLVTVTSIAPNALVEDKNSAPAVTKTENVRTSSVGDTVTYTVTINLPQGTNNVKFHDSLTEGLQLQGTTVSGISTVADADHAARRLALNTHFTVDQWSNTKKDGDNITITFTDSFLNNKDFGPAEHPVVLSFSYTAKLSAAAGINMQNEAYLTYGESNTESTHQKVYESTFGFTVNKLDGQNNLNGAEFVLSKNGNLGNLTKDNVASHSNDLLNFASDGTYDPNSTDKYLRTANNALTYKGLNNDDADSQIVYYLYEVTAPDGYNKLAAPVEIHINPTFAEGDINAQTQVLNFGVRYNVPSASNSISNTAQNNDATLADKSTVATANDADHNIWIVNTKGTPLPSAGGPGTIWLYVIGGVLVAAAAVGLIARRRMRQH